MHNDIFEQYDAAVLGRLLGKEPAIHDLQLLTIARPDPARHGARGGGGRRQCRGNNHGCLACIHIMNSYRIDTQRRKLKMFTFVNLEYRASVFRQYWTLSEACETNSIDEAMMRDVREVKAVFLSFNQSLDNYRVVLKQQLSPVSDMLQDEPQSPNHTLVCKLLGIGAGLSQSKDLKDMFVDLVGKMDEPVLSMGMAGARH